MAMYSIDRCKAVNLTLLGQSQPLPTRKHLVVTGTALLVGLLASTAAQATTCQETVPGLTDFLPIGRGGAISSLISVIDTANTAFLSGTSAFVSAPGNAERNQQGGGVWVRGIGGTVDVDNTTRGPVAVGLFDAANNPIEIDVGNVRCNTTTEQDFYGFQVGRDIAQLNFDGTGLNVHFGLTSGYFEANSKESGGSFSAKTQVPFAGLYAVATKGNFFADGLVRWDFFDNTLTDRQNGLYGQKSDARSFSITGNVGYRIDVHPNSSSKWFLEPSAGFVWSRAEVDPLNVSGTLITLPPTGVALPGTATIDDIDGALGRLSVRVGTTFTSGNMAWQPFATASVFHEFAGDVATTQFGDFVLPVPLPDGTAAISSLGLYSTSRVGTYGQFGLGIAGQVIGTGWLGYGRVDYRTGENIEGVSGNLGLRYQFTPDPVQSASLKDGKGFHAPVPEEVNWTGFYVGGFAGMTEYRHEVRYRTSKLGVTPEPSGYLLGGTLGYNHQMGKWVIGIEGDIGGTNAQGGKACPNAFFFTCEAEMSYLGTVTGRLGYAWGRVLFYAKGGLAFAELTDAARWNPQAPIINPFPPPPVANAPSVESDTQRFTGWTIGTGAEFALSQNWSAKGEWMYYDLGEGTFIEPITSTNNPKDVEVRGSAVRIGVNYHFNH